MKVRIRPHPAIWKEFNIKGLPFWERIEGIDPQGHAGYKKLMIMIEPKKELLSLNEQAIYEPVAEVIADKENVPNSILQDRRLIVEEYEDETLPKTKKQSKGGI